MASARREAAPRMAAQIQATLQELAMPSARFAVDVDGDGPADQVTFLLGANAGEPLQSLAKAASGGELARTMLAIRLAITDTPGSWCSTRSTPASVAPRPPRWVPPWPISAVTPRSSW